jgi:hypothetical protein
MHHIRVPAIISAPMCPSIVEVTRFYTVNKCNTFINPVLRKRFRSLPQSREHPPPLTTAPSQLRPSAFAALPRLPPGKSRSPVVGNPFSLLESQTDHRSVTGCHPVHPLPLVVWPHACRSSLNRAMTPTRISPRARAPAPFLIFRFWSPWRRRMWRYTECRPDLTRVSVLFWASLSLASRRVRSVLFRPLRRHSPGGLLLEGNRWVTGCIPGWLSEMVCLLLPLLSSLQGHISDTGTVR